MPHRHAVHALNASAMDVSLVDSHTTDPSSVADGCPRTFSRRNGGRLHAVAEATASINEDDVYKAFSKLQNGSDIRGVAIAGKIVPQMHR